MYLQKSTSAFDGKGVADLPRTSLKVLTRIVWESLKTTNLAELALHQQVEDSDSELKTDATILPLPKPHESQRPLSKSRQISAGSDRIVQFVMEDC